MRRLEHVYCHGLSSNPPHLEISLSRVTYADATARAILDWLRARGVRLVEIVPSPEVEFRRERSMSLRPVKYPTLAPRLG